MSIILRAVEEEFRGSGSTIGYRSMHQRLTNYHQLIVTRNTVREVLKILDPEGVQSRSRKVATKVAKKVAKREKVQC